MKRDSIRKDSIQNKITKPDNPKSNQIETANDQNKKPEIPKSSEKIINPQNSPINQNTAQPVSFNGFIQLANIYRICKPFIGAKVQLYYPNKTPCGTPATTNFYGQYFFYNIPTGDYYIQVNNTLKWTQVIAVCQGCPAVPPFCCY